MFLLMKTLLTEMVFCTLIRQAALPPWVLTGITQPVYWQDLVMQNQVWQLKKYINRNSYLVRKVFILLYETLVSVFPDKTLRLCLG